MKKWLERVEQEEISLRVRDEDQETVTAADNQDEHRGDDTMPAEEEL